MNPEKVAENAAPDGSGPRRDATAALMATSRLVTAVVARTLGAVDELISVPQLRVLVILHACAPTNVTTLAEALGVNPSNASRTCDKLVTAGLVSRVVDEDDRRHVSLSLSDRGRRVVETLLAEREAVLDQIVGRLPVADQRRLADALGAFVEAAEGAGFATDAEADGAGSLIRWLR